MIPFNIIDSFSGEYRFLSNFWRCFVTYKGVTYPSSEHAYQAAKSNDPNYKSKFLDFSLSSGKAKELGSKAILIDDWESIKLQVMYDVVYDKFSQNDDLKKLLLNTGDTILIEGNTWGDVFWAKHQKVKV